jgi:hypothetical protein
MNLNLHIIKEELLSYHPIGELSGSPTIFPLRYATLYEKDSHLDAEHLYIISAEELTPPLMLSPDISLLCLGTPSHSELNDRCNLIYISQKTSKVQMLNEVSEIFQKYYSWENRMHKTNLENLPLKELGRLAVPFIDNPFWLLDANYKIIFQIADQKKVPKSYAPYLSDDNSYIPLEGITELSADPEYLAAAHATEPEIYSGALYGFRSLHYNIRIQGAFIARLCIDEIIRPISSRDFAIIKILGDFIRDGIMQKDLEQFNRSRDLDHVLTSLLSHTLVDERRIDKVLKESGWSMEDAYFCAVLDCSLMQHDPKSLNSMAIQLSIQLHGDSYIVFKNKIVFIFNLTQVHSTREQLIAILKPLLRDNLVTGGISTIFYDFKNLYYYYKQALSAYEIGIASHPTEWFHPFEKYNLDYLISNCSDKLIPEVLYPDGLKRLIQYDKLYETDYTKLLCIYLENNMNITESTKVAFLHRNTFLYRMKRIREILGLDLKDPNVRLLLGISFAILKRSRD